jgi:hypothetical protein
VLYPFVLFSAPRARVPLEVLHHELVHVRQVRARGWLGFYTAYLLEYARGRSRGLSHHQAYMAISFEAEAYREQTLLSPTEAEKQELGLGIPPSRATMS